MGEAMIDFLRGAGATIRDVRMDYNTKKTMVEDLQYAIEKREITLQNNDTLINELLAYDIERTKAGRVTYNAPSGMHDDCVMSLAIAWHGCDGGGKRWWIS